MASWRPAAPPCGLVLPTISEELPFFMILESYARSHVGGFK
jgi:hypothetical protein